MMSYTDYLQGGPTGVETRALNAEAAVTVPAFRFVKAGTTQGTLDICGLGQTAIGISTGPSFRGNGGRTNYGTEGTFTIEAGAAVNRKDAEGKLTLLASDANGKAIPISTVGITGAHFALARMAEDSASAGTDGDYITVFYLETPMLFTVANDYA